MQSYNTLRKSVHYIFAKLCHDSHSKEGKSDFFRATSIMSKETFLWRFLGTKLTHLIFLASLPYFPDLLISYFYLYLFYHSRSLKRKILNGINPFAWNVFTSEKPVLLYKISKVLPSYNHEFSLAGRGKRDLKFVREIPAFAFVQGY